MMPDLAHARLSHERSQIPPVERWDSITRHSLRGTAEHHQPSSWRKGQEVWVFSDDQSEMLVKARL